MMPHARLLAASSLVTAGLLVLGPEAVVALADADTGSSTTGGTSGSSATGTTGSTGTSGGSATTGTGTSTTGGSTSTGSSTTGSTATGTTPTTGGASSWSPPNVLGGLGGMVGQFTQIIQHPTSIIGGPPLTGLVPGVKANSNQGAPLLTPGSPSTFSASVPAPTNNAAPQPAAAQVAQPTQLSQDSTSPTAPKPPLAQLPLTVAQVPLTALDLVKTTIPTVVDAVPIPGLAALPVFADALINPIEGTVRDLATAASNLPFLQYTPGMPAIQLPPDNRVLQQNGPQLPKTFAASTDSLPRDVAPAGPAAPGTTVTPVPPIQPRDVFAAERHLVASGDFRPGYPEYLRAAGLSEVAAVAVPGFAGIITLTAAGGLVGYRQARATSSAPGRAQRFVN
ncbi:hypothetical protein [Mycolicibacterium sp. CBMA 226]|uniref:hypothetical protein n=1 Tax=Mycolicibacterium sp. CBMA 226 TaxID=2606611 RepID=UPI0012DE60D1|nr:hypothetical protein [Mycolicibacterium sp. CBMA 226]